MKLKLSVFGEWDSNWVQASGDMPVLTGNKKWRRMTNEG